MTRDEQVSYREIMHDMMRHLFEATDGMISHTNGKHTECDIWQGIDDECTFVLVDAMIGAGVKNAVAAEAVRRMGWVYKRFQIGFILFPRFVKTVEFYAENGGIVLPWSR